ncbi:MAG: hypothetical protein RIQ37_452, partial [Actinomycetota bacterium]
MPPPLPRGLLTKLVRVSIELSPESIANVQSQAEAAILGAKTLDELKALKSSIVGDGSPIAKLYS